MCVDHATDSKNCGACGNSCRGGTVCSAGSCVCPPAQVLCGGVCVTATSCTCQLPTVDLAATCGNGGLLPIGHSCKPSCIKKYYATVYAIKCGPNGLDVASFTCVPYPVAPHIFPESKCPMPNIANATAAGAASITGSEATVVVGAAMPNEGVVQYPGVLLQGLRMPVEFSFDFFVTDGGSGTSPDGLWGVLTSDVTDALSTAGMVIDSTAIVGIEVDLSVTAAADDPAGPHVAVVYQTENHAAYPDLERYVSVSTGLQNSWHKVSLLVELSRSQFMITSWLDGTTTGTGYVLPRQQMVDMLRGPGMVVRPTFYASTQATAPASLAKVRNVKVCGGRSASLWYKMVPASGTMKRYCIQQLSFGNPEPTRTGLWKPRGCPVGARLTP